MAAAYPEDSEAADEQPKREREGWLAAGLRAQRPPPRLTWPLIVTWIYLRPGRPGQQQSSDRLPSESDGAPSSQ